MLLGDGGRAMPPLPGIPLGFPLVTAPRGVAIALFATGFCKGPRGGGSMPPPPPGSGFIPCGIILGGGLGGPPGPPTSGADCIR